MGDRRDDELKRPAPQCAPRRKPAATVADRRQEIARAGLSGPGGPLPYRDQLERSFGVSLGGIRAHQGLQANEAAELLDAKAYATQGHVVLPGGGD